MTRSIPWPRIFAEGFAIVLSILLAFGIQAWWEERQDRAVEQALLTGLVEDLRQDSADYAGFAAVYRDRVTGADFLLSLGNQDSSGEPGSGTSGEEMTPGRAFQLSPARARRHVRRNGLARRQRVGALAVERRSALARERPSGGRADADQRRRSPRFDGAQS